MSYVPGYVFFVFLSVIKLCALLELIMKFSKTVVWLVSFYGRIILARVFNESYDPKICLISRLVSNLIDLGSSSKIETKL